MKSAGESSDLSKEPIKKAMSATMMTVGSGTIGVLNIAGAATGTGEFSESLKPPGIFGNFKKEFEERRDTGFDVVGEGVTEGAGDDFALFHAAVAAKRERGAE